LAEAPRQERRVSPLISASIGIAAALTVSSGIYLYLEGQELWEKAKTPPRIAAAQTSPTRAPAAAPAAAAPLVAPAKPQAAADVTDHVHQNAMAPTREVQTGLLIQPREDGVQLRSGPGTEYAVIGHGLRELKYAVADWNDRWFRIRIPNSAQTAWVRNDLVQLTTK
jgi:hypothetical protein